MQGACASRDNQRGAGSLPASLHLTPQPPWDVCLPCLGTHSTAEPPVPCHGGQGAAVPPCPPHGAPTQCCPPESFPQRGAAQGAGGPPSLMSSGHTDTWHGEPGHQAASSGGSVPSRSHWETSSAWPPSRQYQEWPGYCCVCQEAIALISLSPSPCFLGLSISRYLSKNSGCCPSLFRSEESI